MCGDKIHQGGGVAAPIGSQVFGEILPYLEIKKDNEESGEKQEVEVPNLIGMTVKEAKETLENLGLEIEIKEEEENNSNQEKTITKQLPKAGIKIKQGTSVIVFV